MITWQAQYKKTVVFTQSLIGVVVIALLFMSRSFSVAAVFFAVMQTGALVGALWSARLRRRLQRTMGV
jgi:hypothetical protein